MIKAVRLDTAPGIIIYRMTAEHTSIDGRVWPAGTEYQPFLAGKPGQVVHVLPNYERVTFEAQDRDQDQ